MGGGGKGSSLRLFLLLILEWDTLHGTMRCVMIDSGEQQQAVAEVDY